MGEGGRQDQIDNVFGLQGYDNQQLTPSFTQDVQEDVSCSGR